MAPDKSPFNMTIDNVIVYIICDTYIGKITLISHFLQVICLEKQHMKICVDLVQIKAFKEHVHKVEI